MIDSVFVHPVEEALKFNTVCKLFCEFDITEKVPDHSLFGDVRKRMGPNKLSKLFSIIRDQLRVQGYMNEVFTFVD